MWVDDCFTGPNQTVDIVCNNHDFIADEDSAE